LKLGLCFSVLSDWVWPEMKNVAGDDLAGDGGSRLGQLSPVSAIAGKVREREKKKKKRKKPGSGACVR
jgi:hypothetical protein